jgi:hypothetical protein
MRQVKKLSTIDSLTVFDVKVLDAEREAIANYFNEKLDEPAR